MKESPTVLVVHPDSRARALLARTLPSFGYAIRLARSGEDGIAQVISAGAPVVLLELNLPGMSGLETLRALHAMSSPPEVVLTMSDGALDAVAAAACLGAFDFVPQPFDFAHLSHVLRAAHHEARRRRQSQPVEAAVTAQPTFPEIVGQGLGIKRVLGLIAKAAPTDFPVLIQGESGTGKELVARALHASSPRVRFPLTVVDCGAIQDTLLESELFGHERGAFTGAYGVKQGLFEAANGGTLFLDEIGEMSPATQAKVLRALQSGEFRRIGSNRSLRVDVRVVAATNKDLRAEVRRGRFREDLYYRIAVIEIHMPPLRERTEDIPLLVEHFLRTGSYAGRRLQLAPQALRALMAYPWPGNIRELRNHLERLSVLAETQGLTGVSLLPGIGNGTPAEGIPEPLEDLPLKEVERRHILRTLQRHHWNKKRTATVLGIDIKTLYNKLRGYSTLDIDHGTAAPLPPLSEPPPAD